MRLRFDAHSLKQYWIIYAMHSGDNEHDKQNNLQQLEKILKHYHAKTALLMISVDASKERVEINDVIPLS